MSARYEFKVGPANRNSDYANPVTVLADSYSEAKAKAIAFRGYAPRDSSVWLIRIEEVPEVVDSSQSVGKG
ncbi:hypothetical protein HYQ00_gp78 [Arthrobacter phage TripleJ]|uniref:Uncharacterized protein n=1 Tax=Arthrobacter phage TripleJ TaxID=2599838 RepID=A0A5J6TLL2_9CAUD|nr:hypothetical protein HYQ00_gp78 [Arthrobacter phage TripleJ]QFG09622.1 hypothetical protein PBI_TRIPLEJ_78 [Arthrobacter phage TripleJ]